RRHGDTRGDGPLATPLRIEGAARRRRGRRAARYEREHGMNHNDAFIGDLEDYLHEFDGATPLPDHVRDAVHAELPRTRQVHRPGPLRLITMLSNTSSGARLGLVAATFVVAAILGAAILDSRSTEIGGATPTVTPTESPRPALSPSVGPSAAARSAETPAMLRAGNAV